MKTRCSLRTQVIKHRVELTQRPSKAPTEYPVDHKVSLPLSGSHYCYTSDTMRIDYFWAVEFGRQSVGVTPTDVWPVCVVYMTGRSGVSLKQREFEVLYARSWEGSGTKLQPPMVSTESYW